MLISYSCVNFVYYYSYVFVVKLFCFMCKNSIRDFIKLFESENVSCLNGIGKHWCNQCRFNGTGNGETKLNSVLGSE
jgi:hypothetical protein